LSPIDASAKTRNGIITTDRKKESPTRGMTTRASARMMAIPILSCRIGNTAMSAA
jgi:hypothetical protein